MRKVWTVIIVLVFLMGARTFRVQAVGREVAPSTEAPTPTPIPSPMPAENANEKTSGIARVVFNPTASLKELASGMLRDTFKDIDGTMEGLLNKLVAWVWKLVKTPDGGMYATASKPFTAVGIALFVPMALLRLVWYHKHVLIGDNDALTAVAFDIVVAAIVVLGIGHFIDWTAQKTFTLVAVVLEKVGIHGVLSQHLGLSEIGVAMGNSIGTLLMFGFLLLGGILAILAFGMAFVAVHGMFYLLTALGPIVFTIGMLPPLGWLKKVWWMGFGAVILAPFVGASALGALALVLSINFGIDALLVKYMIRMVWLWAAAGMMWTLLGLLTRFTLATSMQLAGKLVGGVTSAVAGLAAAGALAGAGGFSLGSLGNGLGIGGGGNSPAPFTPGSEGGSTAPSTPGDGDLGGSGLSAASPQEHVNRAAEHSLRAGAFSALSHVPGLGGLSAAAGYHRTLADVHRLRGMRPSGRGGGGGKMHASEGNNNGANGAPSAPHTAALNMFSQIGEGGEGEYKSALQGVQGKLKGIEDPELGPVMPAMWSETNDPNLSRLSAGLAALYRREPQLFDGMNANKWLEVKNKAQQIIGGDE